MLHCAKPWSVWLFGILLSAGCTDAASVGSDACWGEGLSCQRQPRDVELLPPRSTLVQTRDLPVLDPVWTRSVDAHADCGQGAGQLYGTLTGSGTAGLWYVERGKDGRSIHLHTLNEEGEVTGESVVSGPPIDAYPAEYRDEIMDERVQALGPNLLNAHGAPSMSLSWQIPDAPVPARVERRTLSSFTEVLALPPDLDTEPTRVVREGVAVVAADHTGVWSFGAGGILTKWDRQGKQVIRQPILKDRIPINEVIGLVHEPWIPTVVVSPTDGHVWLLAYHDRLPPHQVMGTHELWRFDEAGTPLTRFGLGDWTGVRTLTVDRHGRVLLISVSQDGDLELRRLDPELNELVSAHSVRRESFTFLYPRDVTEDAAGNIYVTSDMGPRELRQQRKLLCKLPLAGELTCFTLSNVSFAPSVAVSEGVLFGFESTSLSDPQRVLRRYEIP